MRPRCSWSIALLVSLGLFGCTGGGGGPGVVDPPSPMPGYSQVATRYNARVEPLAELWAATVIRVWYPGEAGEEKSDQVDGHLQIRRPDRCSITFEKVGEMYLMLGSDAERYWWFDLAEEKTASVGLHANATPERVEGFGIPVHPLDLVELMGVNPLPPEGEIAWDGRVGRLIVTVPGRWGARRLFLDPVTLEPSRIELLGAAGEVALVAELSKYTGEQLRGPAGTRIASEVLIRVERESASARIRLYEARNHSTRDAAFDLERLKRAYSIARVIDLDAP